MSEQLAPARQIWTVIALYDDYIDAEHALIALQRADQPAKAVSVLARDRPSTAGGSVLPLDLSKTVGVTAISAVSSWLIGLASLVVPDQGTLLVAGPIGVALAQLHQATSTDLPVQPDPVAAPDEKVGSVAIALMRFGFRPEEATYLDHRLAAGSIEIAVQVDQADLLDNILRIFADHNAVFVGQALTDPGIAFETESVLMTPAVIPTGDVVIADIVAPLRRICTESDETEPLRQWCGRDVVAMLDEPVGSIDDVIADVVIDRQGQERVTLRYILVGNGGVLGHGRRRVGVPARLVSFDSDPPRLSVTREAVQQAPGHDTHTPFSRREELALHNHFGLSPYWLEETSGARSTQDSEFPTH